MKRYQSLLISSLAILILLPSSALAAQIAKYPPQVKEMVLETRKHIKTIDMDEFRRVVDNRQGRLIVDTREPVAFTAGHVPGSINIPRGLIEFKIWKHVGFPDKTDYNKAMYIYCGTGGRCTLATKSLQDLGFTNVSAVVMKLEDWLKAGHPFVK
jgi:rhodanese-related sulfurtransferase